MQEQEFQLQIKSSNLDVSKNKLTILPSLPILKNALVSPMVAYLLVTSKCNLRCKHCFVSEALVNNPSMSEMSLNQIKSTVDELKKNNVLKIILTGGEVFLRPDIVEIIDYIFNQGLLMQINTNATLINAEILGKLVKYKSLINHFTVSLEGLMIKHDEIRGQNNYNRVIDAIQLIKEHSFDLLVNITIKKSVIQDIDKIMKELLELGVSRFNFSRMRPTGINREYMDEFFDYSLNDYNDFMKKNYSYQKKYALKEYVDNMDSSELFDVLGVYCSAAAYTAAIYPDGRVSPCSFLDEVFSTLDIQFDNILEKSFFDIWRNSKSFLYMRNFKNKCPEACEYLNICGKQCPLESYKQGDLHGRSLYCYLANRNQKFKDKLV